MIIKGLIDCAKQTIAVDGFIGLYKGLNVNVVRAILVNAAELATYDKAKYSIIKTLDIDRDSKLTHFLASLCSGFVVFNNLIYMKN